MGPEGTKPHVSVARLPQYWYPVCLSKALERKPLKVTLLGIPLVVFRTEDGRTGALLDRCAHRNVPLSKGTVRGSCLECCYHGWRFDTSGACQKIPGLLGPIDSRSRRVQAFATRDQDGLVWVYATPDVEPEVEPYRFPHLDDSRYTHALRTVDAEASVHATVENALDVPHTAFLHKGLFRGAGRTNEITAQVTRYHDRVQAEYIGEPRPEGLAAKILSPSGGTVTHFDRFIMPCIAQVDYSIGDDTHFIVTSVCTPVTDFETRLFAVASFRLKRLPGWLIKPILEPIGRKVFAQDAAMLKLQTESIRTFGGEQYQSTEIDVLGPHIWRLMKQAERGESGSPEDPPFEKTIRLRV